MASSNIREEEVKNRLRDQFFQDYDATPILGDIDFAVALRQDEEQDLFDREYFLWAEAKAGMKEDILASFVQLIITIGKARTHEKLLPPRFLGAFDEEKIAFIEFHNVLEVFYQNDFNWNVTPSNHDSREFHYLYDMLHDQLSREISLFDFKKDEKELRRFIRSNFKFGKKRTSGINITKNNYLFVFQRWVEEVKPSIEVNWNDVPKTSVVDFFYADLISRNDYTLREELAVVLRGDHYKILQDFLSGGTPLFSEASFNDKMVAYRQFWNKYNRPPRHEYLDIILKRRDLLIPQDLRRYQGAFFTPPQWVQKSQEYLAVELGEDWQQNYYVWDCCAGTGNLLFGLTEPYRIWASTLDDADVQVMKERIKEKSLDLLERHVFQFDFLNDSFDRLPEGLRNIINDPEKRKHLVIYINPPYAEAGNKEAIANNNVGNKSKVARDNKMCQRFNKSIGSAINELFVQFIMRIHVDLSNCILAEFSKLKILQAPNFVKFRQQFRAKLGRLFLVPASSFDNVKGKFPIGFFIWHTGIDQPFKNIEADVFDCQQGLIGRKNIEVPPANGLLMDWIKTLHDKSCERIAFLRTTCSDFQNQNGTFITSMPSNNDILQKRTHDITKKNFADIAVSFAVRLCIEATWLNDRDQFLYPNDSWKTDATFQSDCLAFTLFNGQNRISSCHGVNHWIPFTEEEVGAQDAFNSHFMHNYIMGKNCEHTQSAQQQEIFGNATNNSPHSAITFSTEAQAVMDAGRELWRYYHRQPKANPNASYYDIRLHFQGVKTTAKGKEQMNSESKDPQYTALLVALKQRMKELARKIEPKVYEYGFLKQ